MSTQSGREVERTMENTAKRTVERAMLLAGTELFSPVGTSLRLAIAERSEEQTVASGGLLFAAGDPGGSMFVILDGEAAVIGDHGATLNHLQRGDVLGELAALDGAPRSASVRALTDLVVLRLPAELLIELATTRAEVGSALLRLVAQRLHARAADRRD